jgi:hypothetical protein
MGDGIFLGGRVLSRLSESARGGESRHKADE